MQYSLQAILGLTIIIALFYFIDFNKFWDALSKTKFVYVLLAMMVYPTGLVLGSFRLNAIFEHLGKKISFRKILSAQFGGMLASDVTPGRTGYFVLPLLIREDVPITSGLSAIMSVQVIDFFVKVISTITGVIIIAYTAKLDKLFLGAALLGIIIVTIFTVLMAVALWSRKSRAMFRLLSKLPLVGKFAMKFEDKIEHMQAESEKIKSIMPKLILLTLPPWFAKGIEWYLLGTAVGFAFPFWIYMFLQPIITIVQFVPLTPAGLGLQEGGSILILLLIGTTMESALLFSFLGRAILIIVDMIGLPLLLRKGIRALS